MKTNKNTDNQSVEEKYYAMVEQVFDQVEARRRGGEKVIHESLTEGMKVWYLSGLCGAAGLVGAASVVALGLAQGPVDLNLVAQVGFSAVAGTAVLSSWTLTKDSAFVRGLGLAGKTIRLSPYQKSQLADWSQQHPRIFDLLTRWGARHPDLEITGADYYPIQKAMEKIERKTDYYHAKAKAPPNEAQFETKLRSAIRRKALTERSGKSAEKMERATPEKAQPKM